MLSFFEECIIIFQAPAQFPKNIKMSRILLSINLNFGCSYSVHSLASSNVLYHIRIESQLFYTPAPAAATCRGPRHDKRYQRVESWNPESQAGGPWCTVALSAFEVDRSTLDNIGNKTTGYISILFNPILLQIIAEQKNT